MRIKLTEQELKKRKATRDHNRYQKLRTAQLLALGSKCIECSNTNLSELEVHHLIPFGKRSRTRALSYFSTDPTVVKVMCGPNSSKKCHKDTPNYRGKGKKK
jgi:hypothetical protein